MVSCRPHAGLTGCNRNVKSRDERRLTPPPLTSPRSAVIFVEKAAAACAAPALKYFYSILHHNLAFTQNLGLTRVSPLPCSRCALALNTEASRFARTGGLCSSPRPESSGHGWVLWSLGFAGHAASGGTARTVSPPLSPVRHFISVSLIKFSSVTMHHHLRSSCTF